jgi:hypothetical protein
MWICPSCGKNGVEILTVYLPHEDSSKRPAQIKPCKFCGKETTPLKSQLFLCKKYWWVLVPTLIALIVFLVKVVWPWALKNPNFYE